MSRPIPIDILPSHVFLSKEDQETLFGEGYPMTIVSERSQVGQYVYEESVEVFGKLKRHLKARVLGPYWKHSHVELTPTEAVFLGMQLEETKSGNLELAGSCRLKGPAGEVELPNGALIPRPHIMCSPEEAKSLNIWNGEEVSVSIMGEQTHEIDRVLVRVHPTFRLRLELHQDYARDFWIVRPTHARLKT